MSVHVEPLSFAGEGQRARVADAAGVLSMERAFAELATSPALAHALTDFLCDVPFEAVQWETPPLSSATRALPFEFVVLPCSILASARPEPNVFAEHFAGVDSDVVEFENLGGDAHLIAPVPHDDRDDAHLLRFLRAAPRETSARLWSRVGQLAAARTSDAPVWVNTAGQGVFWLHVRLDARPKYLRHAPYRTPTWTPAAG